MFIYRVEPGSSTVAVRPPRLQFAEGQIKKGVAYEWEFPDPGGRVTKTGPQAEHTFTKPGSYTIKLRVKDTTWGTSSTTTRVVQVPAPAGDK
jgi:PKD repeat protein